MIVDDREPAHPGHAALGPGHPTAGCPDYAQFPYDTGQLTVPNKCSGKLGGLRTARSTLGWEIPAQAVARVPNSLA